MFTLGLAPLLVLALWASPASALTTQNNNPQICVAGLGWYGLLNNATIATTGSPQATATSHATADGFSTGDCDPAASHTTPNIACPVNEEVLLMVGAAYYTFSSHYFPTPTHQTTWSVTGNPGTGKTVWTDSVVITNWGNSCESTTTAETVSPTLLT